MGSPLDDRAWTQATLTPSLGGLGLRRVVDHADGAFAASWHESQGTARESWIPPPQASVHKGSQTQASLAFDKVVHAKLVSESSSQREKQRLGRLVAGHAGAWVTAVPSRIEGSDCVMSPSVFRTAVRYRLGVHVARPDVSCSFCTQPFDLYGDHAACCKKNADVIVRHNRIRNLVAKMGDEGLLSRKSGASLVTPRNQGGNQGMLLSPLCKTPRVWLLTFASLRLSQPRTFVWTILPTSVVFTSTRSTTRGSRQQTSAFRLLLLKRQEE